MRMPAQKPGKSFQAYRTPTNFLDAAKKRLQIADWTIDLAADVENRVTERYYDETQNSLVQPWNVGQEDGQYGWAWCNPPFAHLAPWVEKAFDEEHLANIAMLVPAAVGANWWAEYVDGVAQVLLLNGRLSFDGKTPYPKDLVLLLYGPSIVPSYAVWSWKA